MDRLLPMGHGEAHCGLVERESEGELEILFIKAFPPVQFAAEPESEPR